MILKTNQQWKPATNNGRGDVCGWGDICGAGWPLWVLQPPYATYIFFQHVLFSETHKRFLMLSPHVQVVCAMLMLYILLLIFMGLLFFKFADCSLLQLVFHCVGFFATHGRWCKHSKHDYVENNNSILTLLFSIPYTQSLRCNNCNVRNIMLNIL